MGIVLRRAATAWSLLAAAAGAALVGTVLITGSTVHARQVLADGARSTIDTASLDERSIVVRGPLEPGGAFDERDAAVRARTAPRFGGVDTDVRVAGYAAARRFVDDVGRAVPDADGRVYASVAFLEDLPAHAGLLAGRWPTPGATPVQASLGEAVATVLGVRAGDRVTILDGFTDRRVQVQVTGVWRPRQAGEPYWQLFPAVAGGVVPRSSTYGPVVLDRADFMAGYRSSASAAWVVAPRLTGATPSALDTLAAAAVQAVDDLPTAVGFGTSAVTVSRLDVLVRRLHQSDLVGRSALATPMLLLAVLGGYTLLLIALLLSEQRTAETALLRARGAGRGRIVGLTAREALLVVAPAVLLAPWLATAAVRAVDPAAGRLSGLPDRYAWGVALLAAAACAAAMLIPAVRSGGTYVAALATRSRPGRRAAAQRAGLDLVLVALAILGWLQLRQYSSPLAGDSTGRLGLDPLLAAAPTLAVLAGAAVGLRTLPALTGLAQRQADRRSWLAGTFGMWQAGRRAHAGPVLLLALAVAVSTLAWCLSGTSQQSVADQTDHLAGADVRVTQVPGQAIDAARLAALPGVRRTLPVLRDTLSLGPDEQPATMVAVDAARAGGAVHLRADLADGDPQGVFTGLATGRGTSSSVPLPPGRLTGTVRVDGAVAPVVAFLVVTGGDGLYRRIPLHRSGVGFEGGRPWSFAVDPPAGGGVHLIGIMVQTRALIDTSFGVRLAGLRAAGTPIVWGPSAGWRMRDTRGGTGAVELGDVLTARYTVRVPGGEAGQPIGVTAIVDRVPPVSPVPIAATDAALAQVRLRVGEESRIRLGAVEVPVRVTRAVRAVPGTADPAAVLVDLPALQAAYFDGYGITADPGEWWLVAGPADHASVAAAARGLGDVQVLDRRDAVQAAGRDPYGRGARIALFAAALGAVLLAGLGLIVDVRATARRRAGELAVFHILGAGPRLLARSLVAEQGVLAAVGLTVGVLVGIGVAATLAPLVILTPAAGRPVPEPLLAVPWGPVLASVAVLAASTLGLSALIALTVRRRLVAAQLRIGTPE